jgi:hypothetical protein
MKTDLRTILIKMKEVFPLFTMGETFKATHAILMNGDSVALLIWYKGRSWDIILDAEEESHFKDFDDKGIVDFLLGVKAEIENHLGSEK